jgi:hypothetical protein
MVNARDTLSIILGQGHAGWYWVTEGARKVAACRGPSGRAQGHVRFAYPRMMLWSRPGHAHISIRHAKKSPLHAIDQSGAGGIGCAAFVTRAFNRCDTFQSCLQWSRVGIV